MREQLTARRKSSGYTHESLAEYLGVTDHTVWRWENGHTTPRPDHRNGLCTALQITHQELDTLLNNQTPQPPPPEKTQPAAVEPLPTPHASPDGLSAVECMAMLDGLQEILTAHVVADATRGPLWVVDSLALHLPLVERMCHTTRGADRVPALRFGARFLEFLGWLNQDLARTATAMASTNKALDYALELDDPRVIRYSQMRKSNIAVDRGETGHGLVQINAALTHSETLTPRLRAVILRQRANVYARLKDVAASKRDAEAAVEWAEAGESQQESDRAPYCSPAYVAAEAGGAHLALGRPREAVEILEGSRQRFGTAPSRDGALCVARLATAYARAGEPEQACATADEAIALAGPLGSARVAAQLARVGTELARWSHNATVAGTVQRLSIVGETYRAREGMRGAPTDGDNRGRASA